MTFFEDPKEKKRERKRKTHKDRSKFKKTDVEKRARLLVEQQKEKIGEKALLRGRVLSCFPEEILVEADNTFYKCILKGSLKKEWTTKKNLIVPGDFVLFDPMSLNIYCIENRTSFLSKASSKKEQLIASNIDFVLITASIGTPPLNLPLIDRYIIATKKGGMEPIILINKCDLLKSYPEQNTLVKLAQEIYNALHIDLILLSVHTGEGIRLLKKKMASHSSVFAGESGVGKTSLINTLTGLNLETKNITRKIQRGSHTTTRAHLIPLDFGGWCIDTPGIQKFGLWDLKREDLDLYFPEILALKHHCHFFNCTHTHEPDCFVKTALLEKKLSQLRYDSYVALSSEIK